MRFVIYGAGGIGGTIGARLHQAGFETALIARRAHFDAIVRDGLRFVSPTQDVHLRIPCFAHPNDAGIGPDDAVVLCMKGQHTEDALRDLHAATGGDARVICCQNGVENERSGVAPVPAHLRNGRHAACGAPRARRGGELCGRHRRGPRRGLLSKRGGRLHRSGHCGASPRRIQFDAGRSHHGPEVRQALGQSQQRRTSGYRNGLACGGRQAARRSARVLRARQASTVPRWRRRGRVEPISGVAKCPATIVMAARRCRACCAEPATSKRIS